MPQATVLDQRSSERFGLALPITLEGEECASHDLSATGLLVEASTAPAVGSAIELTLEYEAHGQSFSLVCRGRVARIEQLEGSCNIGVRLDRPLYSEDPAALG